MADVVSLNKDKPPTAERQQDVVDLLDGLLVEAREGKLQSIACTMIYLGGDQNEDWAGPASAFTLLGAISLLKRAFEDVIIEENE